MNFKNVILLTLAIFGGAMFLVLQKYSKDYYSSLEQPRVPVINLPTTRYLAPDFTLVDLDQNEFKLPDSQGNVVVMMFWTTW
ncbi:MAG: peroxiredoxin family protein [Desulforhopalus sp.]